MFRHCVKLLFVPFYFVRFPDFFLGDQFTSHSQTLVDLLHVLVSLFTGSFLSFRDPFASYSPTTLNVIQISLSILPQFIRLAQNLRRYHDSKYVSIELEVNRRELYPSIYNGIKYLLSIIANSLALYKLPYFCAQFIYTIYALCWDLHEDWGLLVSSVSCCRLASDSAGQDAIACKVSDSVSRCLLFCDREQHDSTVCVDSQALHCDRSVCRFLWNR